MDHSEGIPDLRDDLSAGRQHPEKCRRAPVNDSVAVNENLKFSVVASHHFDIGLQFATQTRRHTDGVES